MDDQKIIAMFCSRSEQAISELSRKYGAVLRKIAANILNDAQDTEECLNDAYLGVWNTIPPNEPQLLLSYVCRIVRNISIAKYHKNNAQKRKSSYDIALDELEGCFESAGNVEDELTMDCEMEWGTFRTLYRTGNQDSESTSAVLMISAMSLIRFISKSREDRLIGCPLSLWRKRTALILQVYTLNERAVLVHKNTDICRNCYL